MTSGGERRGAITEAQSMAKARRLLIQAQGLDPNEVPESVVHLSYYAMFHAASAVLLRHRSSVALTHTGLIGAFGRIAKVLGEEGRQHARALNRAEDLRLRADYGVASDDLCESAAGSIAEAKLFVEFCDSLLST